MGFSENRKEKNVSAYQERIRALARETITLDTFDDKLFIAYDGTPVVEVKEDYTPDIIMSKLEEMRGHFVESKMKSYVPRFMDLLFG